MGEREEVLDSLRRRLLPQGELFSSGMWSLGFDCRCHVDFLALVVTPGSGGHCGRRVMEGSAHKAKPASQFISDH